MKLQKIRETVTLDYPDDEDKFRVTVKVFTAPKFDAKRRACRPDNAIGPDDISLDKLYAMLANDVIAGWDGITDSDGMPVPLTKANAYKLLEQKPEFATWLLNQCTKLEQFLGEEKPSVAKG